jgi:integrase
MVVIESVLKFIVYQSIQNGRVGSQKTIISYANSIYDFFSFLEANNLDWNKPYKQGKGDEISVVALYRNWSLSLTGKSALKRSTINTRLAAIRQFYEFCQKKDLIGFLPWEFALRVRTHDTEGFMRHARTNKPIDSTDLKLKVFKEPPKVLNINQTKELLLAIKNKTLLLMVKLALTTGLRREELITLQREFIFKPNALQMNSRLQVSLIPSADGQRTKGGRPRTIYIPAPLMMDIYDYMQWGEGVKRHKLAEGIDKTKVFLTGSGQEYSETSLNTLLSRLKSSGKIEFSVSPHLLRHTFATVELFAESKRKDMAQALSWVRDRLGHSSIQTTMVYIHCIEQLEDHEIHKYQRELMELDNS